MSEDDGFAAFDALGIAILVIDGSGEIRHRTPTWSRRHGDLLASVRDVVARTSPGETVAFVARLGERWADVAIRPLDERHSVVTVLDVDERVRAQEEVKRLRLRVLTVQEDERRAISQNLHDELGQGMTALAMKISAIADSAQDSATTTGLSEARALVEVITKRMRQLFYRIRPPGLHDDSLTVALADYCTAAAHSSGLTVRFDADDDLPPMGGAEATALYRLLQEALTNVAKHATARSAWVSLTREGAAMSLAVEDDGTGFDPRVRTTGIGLAGLQERFMMLDGELIIDSKVGSGTRLVGTVPLRTSGADS